MVVGNKADLERMVPFEEVDATVCLDWECGYAECSALNKTGVEKVIKELGMQAKSLIKQEDESATEKSSASAFHTKRHSVVRRLFKKDKSKDDADGDGQSQSGDSCNIT